MAIRFPRRESSRKSVQAMRASENGRSGVDSWDASPNTQGSPSNKELMARKKKKGPSDNYESVHSQGSSSSLTSSPKYDPHKYRLQTGDD
jgi:hypothetical protein